MSEMYQSFSQIQEFHKQFLKTISEHDINTFRKCCCDEERIVHVFSLLPIQNYCISEHRNLKSADFAKQFKKDGNHAFQANQFKTAIELYSKSIIKQPQKTTSEKEELSIMFANRSAALYHMQEYELALEDIQSAFDCNYPTNLRFKIYDRKARCFLALNQLKSARDAFRLTIQALDNAKLSEERRQKWQCDIQIMLAMLNRNNHLTNAQGKKTSSDDVQFKKGVSKYYPNMSNTITIKEAPEVGRFAEAKDKIEPGDMLLREKPHCAVLLDQFSQTHCFQCFLRAKAPYPCPLCSSIIFCSKACQTLALQTHHHTECTILPTLWGSGASITCLMALRIITQHDLNYFLQLKPNLSNSDIYNPYKSSDYFRVYKLVNHSIKRSIEDFLQRTLMAVFLLRCLQATDYFKQSNANELKSSGMTLSNNEKFIGGLILRHLQALQFNSHEVSELVINTEEKRSVFIGGAVYPTLALFNHSCNPGIIRYHMGTEVVVRAIRTIKSGEMVAENYGPIFTQVERKARQDVLMAQYWFHCQCEACQENWPILDNMNINEMRFRCECGSTIVVPASTFEFMVPCHSCKKSMNILKGLKVLQDTDAMFRVAKCMENEGNYIEALHKFTELLKLLDTTLVPPFRDYHVCQQEMRTCLLSCGNVHREVK